MTEYLFLNIAGDKGLSPSFFFTAQCAFQSRLNPTSPLLDIGIMKAGYAVAASGFLWDTYCPETSIKDKIPMTPSSEHV